jgi:cytochrome c oxidase subunit 2
LACHSLTGAAGAGPTWQGLYGSTRPLANGETVTADDAYLHESIVNPSAKIAQGFGDIMPKDFGTRLTEEQINQIIEFIKTVE